MKSRSARRRRQSPQPDLFSAAGPAWIKANWPEYARHGRPGSTPARQPIVRWAEAVEKLPAGARAMLITLAREEAETGSCRIGIAALARSLDIARNTCRLQLDTLMEAGLLMMKLRLDQGKAPLGYEIRLVVDLDDRTSALAEGFQAQRACPHTHRSVTARS